MKREKGKRGQGNETKRTKTKSSPRQKERDLERDFLCLFFLFFGHSMDVQGIFSFWCHSESDVWGRERVFGGERERGKEEKGLGVLEECCWVGVI